MFKKLLISFLIGIVFLFSFAPSFQVAAADQSTGTWYNQSFQDWYNKVYDTSNPSEIFGERYTAAQVQWVVYSLFAFLMNSATGPQNTNIIQCFLTNSGNINTCVDSLKSMFTNQSTNTQSFLNNQIQNSNVPLLSLVFADNRPISGISYVKEKIQKISLVSEAHAASTNVGFGYNVLEPIQQMWAAVRNVAFALFVIAIVILAFMVMFRIKISPQVVITIQSAIPKVVIALILVTFSYAIAGFLIDLMYVVIGFISVAMSPLVWGLPATNIFNFLTLGQPWGGSAQFGFLMIWGLYIFLFIIFLLILLVMNLGIIGVAGGVALALTSGVLGIIAILLVIVAVLVMFFLFLKTFWALIKAFAMVILLTVFAPLQIALGVVIPNFGFGAWFKSLISNLAVFIVVAVLVLLSYVFLIQGISIGFSNYAPDLGSGVLALLFGHGSVSLFNPNISSAAWPPLLGGGNSGPGLGLLFLGISFVIITLIPKASEIIQGFITGRPFAYGTAIGEAFGPIRAAYGAIGAPVQRTFQEYGGRVTTADIITKLRGVTGKLHNTSLDAYLDNILKSMQERRK